MRPGFIGSFRPFLSSGSPGFSCSDYTPGQATNPYLGSITVSSQADVDLLIGFDGVDGDLVINDTSLLTDVGPLNALVEVTNLFAVYSSCLPSLIPMTALRYVGGQFLFSINPSVTDVDNFCFNLTRTGSQVLLQGGGALTSFGAGFIRHLYFAPMLSFQLDLTASVSFDGMFPCFTGAAVEFLYPGT